VPKEKALACGNLGNKGPNMGSLAGKKTSLGPGQKGQGRRGKKEGVRDISGKKGGKKTKTSFLVTGKKHDTKKKGEGRQAKKTPTSKKNAEAGSLAQGRRKE